MAEAINTLFNSKRVELIELYKKNGVPFLATTRGLHSVGSIQFDILQWDASGRIGYAVARAGQIINFFAYGLNDSIILSGDPAHRATEADTSLTTKFRTTASADLSIEWITAHARGIKLKYATSAGFTANPPAAGDPVGGMLTGFTPLVDPFANVLPADLGSSATLEHVMYHALAPNLTLRLEWDNADRSEKLGTMDQFAEGGGASFLRANGNPDVNNRYRIPEGFLWGREGQPASNLQGVCQLQSDVVVPIKPVAAPLDGSFPVLNNVWVEILLRVGGLLLRVPGSN
jgi:hypothetical protein